MQFQPEISIGNHNDLLSLLAKGMQATANRNTATLGDRSTYIGMSDIGRYLDCPRATLASKLFTAHDRPLEHLLPLQRGHWFEAGIAPAILSQHPTTFQQLEIEVLYEGVPIRAHLDFVLVQQNLPIVRVLELKSMNRMPDTLHAAHEAQVYGQIGLLRAVWNQPAFSLHDEGGEVLHHRLTFPELCAVHFGLTLPDDPKDMLLEASVLGLSMNEARLYGPYQPDKSMLNLCLKNAVDLWKHMAIYRTGAMSINEMPYAKGFHLLCGYCDWNFDCPKFTEHEHQPEWDADLQRLTELKNSRSALDAEIKEKEQSLKDAYALSEVGDDWISTGCYRFKVSQQAGKRMLNRDRLRLELVDALGDEHAAEKLISWCEEEGKPFERLTVQRKSK